MRGRPQQASRLWCPTQRVDASATWTTESTCAGGAPFTGGEPEEKQRSGTPFKLGAMRGLQRVWPGHDQHAHGRRSVLAGEAAAAAAQVEAVVRSEERRVGKECRSRWSP